MRVAQQSHASFSLTEKAEIKMGNLFSRTSSPNLKKLWKMINID